MNAPMLQGSILQYFLTFIKIQFVTKIFVLSSFELLFYTGFPVHLKCNHICLKMIFASSDINFNKVFDNINLSCDVTSGMQ